MGSVEHTWAMCLMMGPRTRARGTASMEPVSGSLLANRRKRGAGEGEGEGEGKGEGEREGREELRTEIC